MRGDFHIHTTFSDGSFTVEEIIKMAEDANLDVIAITDHDLIDGAINYLNEYHQGNVRIIPGLELSTENNKESVHILGYFPNAEDLDQLERHLKLQRENRMKRAYIMRDKLKEYFNIDLNMDFSKDINSITRGTIANEIINQGYSYTKKEIFDKMIGHGCPAYLPSTKLTTRQGIKLIHESNGLAVLAHPVLLKKNNIEEIIAMGIDGIEAIYCVNTNDDTIRFKKVAKENNLFITAGSDFHSQNDHKHGNIGDVSLDGADLNIFLKKLMEVN